MVQATETAPINLTVEELKAQIKRLNSKAGQQKMDLHDLAEGLPTNYQQLMAMAAETYEIYRQLDELKQQLKIKEKNQ
ncbi:MAG TPA: hypothetical protein DEG17_06360 [Cyanobacteria bacterium UBA11149]|nr:hypothetical protein [Cyanobacteria bacterium UBA11367]HBE58650.1 hypothetical protein [Cyanobacteria bacterium UBA11366]HBK66701.1 hypothetical protein [Cyanobacteria bacterium UBA11166]HBR73958.1 hypothetical protein [Cyanobacteria bacterium UBA11159]HBS69610.1 hypothetical protein [Cyanobacteria bacterium UBA11153]HBW88499.1 hypothetical protein [Cyanobacteria bacterium UBA11149]HCA96405.1 hypothetical protein [Cyanobacteria bacterium UBA9226]